MTDEEKPDGMEKGLRFGCGFLFGAVWGGYLVHILRIARIGKDGHWWVLAVGAALLCGFLAVRYGERFWDWVCEWCSGWWRW